MSEVGDLSTESQCHHQASPLVEPALDVPQLLSRCLGNRELARRLIERFEKSAESLTQSIESQLTSLEFEQAGLLAHRLKGEAANLGAGNIRDNATTIEVACRECQLPVAVGALCALRQNCKQLTGEMLQLLEKVATCEPDPKIPSLTKRKYR